MQWLLFTLRIVTIGVWSGNQGPSIVLCYCLKHFRTQSPRECIADGTFARVQYEVCADMPGANCKIYGCSVSRKAQYKDISIFKVPRVQDEFQNRWRTRFLSIATRDRVVDASLKRQIENHNIGVCELHFRPEEINRRKSVISY